MSKLSQFIAMIRAQTDDRLIELARLANADTTEEGDIVLSALLSELAQRLPEARFLAICEELEA